MPAVALFPPWAKGEILSSRRIARNIRVIRVIRGRHIRECRFQSPGSFSIRPEPGATSGDDHDQFDRPPPAAPPPCAAGIAITDEERDVIFLLGYPQ